MPSRVPTARPSWKRPREDKRLADRQYDRTARDDESYRFYHSPAWLKLRISKLRRSPICEICLKHDIITPATHVHHVVEIRVDRERSLDLDNVQSLCHSCHSRLHASSRRFASMNHAYHNDNT